MGCSYRGLGILGVLAVQFLSALVRPAPCLGDADQDMVLAAEQRRIEVIARVQPAVVCVLSVDGGEGGSGVVVSADGLGVTNFHVVAGMLEPGRAVGGLADGQRYPLEVLGIDPTGDLAAFRLGGKEQFEHVPLGDSTRLRIGEPVFAAGNPFMLAEDFTPTITTGIISGLHRYQPGTDARSLLYSDCIQVDASINPGNSGGPLFNLAGEVIGINGRASFERRGRVNVGLAYAISAEQVRRFLPGLAAGLLVEHGSLGATAIDAGFEQVVFDKVLDASTAAKAGVRVGDRLLSFDGRPIRTANDLAGLLGAYPAGWPVSLAWSRAGELFTATVELDRLPVRVPPELTQRYATDIAVTRAAAASQPTPPEADTDWPNRRVPLPPVEPAMHQAVQAALRGTVKLYGGRIGGVVGHGTGAIVSPDGHIITPLSLLIEAPGLRAVDHQGRIYPCTVQYRDAGRQLALLKMARHNANPDTAVPLDEQMSPADHAALSPAVQDPPQPGDWLIVAGNPFKVADGSEPMSIMQAVLAGRTTLQADQDQQPFSYRGPVLLLDCVTSNPGAAGGVVLDLQGRWVGLIGEAATSRLTNTYANYAYPADELAGFLQEAMQGKPAAATAPADEARPGYHGIKLSRIAYRRQLPFVERVARNSPAATAGVKPDDLIVSANGVAVSRARVFDELCERLHAGDELNLVVKRGDLLVPLSMVLTEPAE